MQAKLYLTKDNEMILDMPEVNKQITFAVDGKATFTSTDVSGMDAQTFESEIYSRIDAAINYSGITPSVAELTMVKALVADKVYTSES